MGGVNSEDANLFKRVLSAAVEPLGVRITDAQQELMWRHYELVVATNAKFNLTRITTPADAAVKHYADSLVLLATGWVEGGERLRVLDVGTGAGFPAVPLAIVKESWQVTAIDGTGKKARFVEECAGSLGLKNLHGRHCRAEELARQGRETFDLVLLRAVTQLGPGIEEVRGLIGRTGSAVFYKSGQMSEEEWEEGRAVAGRYGLASIDEFKTRLVAGEETLERRLIRFRRG